MDLLNSLLIGFYTLLSYSYSQRHTHKWRWVVGSVTLVVRKNRIERTWIVCHTTHRKLEIDEKKFSRWMTQHRNSAYPRYEPQVSSWKCTTHNSMTQRVPQCRSSNRNSVGYVSSKETKFSRGNNLLLRKTVLASRNRNKNEIVLVPIDIIENEFVCKEIPFDERSLFSRETYSWQCRYVPSLSVVDNTNTKYVCVRVYLRNKPSDKKRFGSGKRKRKYFFFSVFPCDQRHAPNYPSLSMCMSCHMSLTIRVW
jgi:hypothetical protein